MIFRNNEVVKVSEHPLYAEMLKAFPEIQKGQPVYMQVLERKKMSVTGQTEGEGEQTFRLHGTKGTLLTFEEISPEGDRVIWRYQDSFPKKDNYGNYEFRKVIRNYCTQNSDTYIFNTDPSSPENKVEELFLIWAFSTEVENGRQEKVSYNTAFYRFSDFARDSVKEIDIENKRAEVILRINKSNINELSSLFQKLYGKDLGSAVNILDVKKQFISKVKQDEGVMSSCYAILFDESGDDYEVDPQVRELCQKAIDNGFIIQGLDGTSVVLKTAQIEETLYSGDAKNVEELCKFVSSDSRTRNTLKRVCK
jgi:hypothetical protein